MISTIFDQREEKYKLGLISCAIIYSPDDFTKVAVINPQEYREHWLSWSGATTNRKPAAGATVKVISKIL